MWEKLAPDSLDRIDWRWTDFCLGKLKALGIRPIVGLVHHGSGPRYTDLLDPQFPEKLAAFASLVAERYPAIDAYTPVNEPLTTARFSALYGHWFPHHRDARSFLRVLVNECRGVALAMRAIREVNSKARLLQTEDLGRTFSTPDLRYQAEFENERRWLTWDLLRGAVDRHHPLWDYLEWTGFDLALLDWFQFEPCPADIVGINYYVTSERYLDERVENYPTALWGNNGRQAYADDAAVRSRRHGLAGIESLLQETARRYDTAIALTEVHLGCCEEEEQLRWFAEAWRAAENAREDGIDVLAVTAWSLLGSFDWDNLVTERRGFYEPGVFDIRDQTRRPTLLASALPFFAVGQPFRHPSLDAPGWWRQPSRLRHAPSLLVNDEPAFADA